MKTWILILSLATSSAWAAAETSTAAEFDSLGGNQIFLDKAKAIQPEETTSIVQNRTVSLVHRVELAPEFSGTFGGDTYSRTKSLGLNALYHFNSRWAVGAKYNYSFNTLTPEGQSLIDQANADQRANPENPRVPYPKLDYPTSEAMALVNWSPIYGKMNLIDKAVAHFDFYVVGGYGQVTLASGATPTYTAGGGLGFWLTQNFSTRVEMRYQNYTAKYFDQPKNMDLTVASVQMGWLL
jgi:outer membrane beta-barrel protein